MKYVFKQRDTFKKALGGKRVYLFLDYDGTLAPIVEKPSQATVPRKTMRLLEALAENQNFKIAVISGRAVEDVKKRLGLPNIIYSGNHGLEIWGPRLRFTSPVTLRYKKILEQIKNALCLKLSSIPGVFVEDKGLSLSLHFRQADRKDVSAVKTIFHETVILHYVRNKIKIREGKEVLEIRPPFEWNKGKVVLWLLARHKFYKKQDDIVPVYIGDDETDEDAFQALGSRGLTIFVGEPKQSCARYYVKDPVEVTRLLEELAVLQRGEDHGSIAKS